ncbi:AMP-binding protein [Streptomyces lavendulae]|uniref:AMP-binding protein n=1 Tax=Streptomyces lavendulae TaxID=1914 RepID=UPI0036E484D2
MTTTPDGHTPWPAEFVDRYWAAGYWRGNTLDDLLRDRALRYGPHTALVHGDTRVTYANLNRRVDRMAAGIRLLGLRPGQRVLVQLPNVPEFVVTAFALMRAGVVPVFVPLPYRADGVSHLVRATQAVGYVAPSTYRGFDHTAMAAEIAAREPFLRRVFTLESPDSPPPYGGGFTTDPAGCHYFPLGSVDAPPGPALAPGADRVALLFPSGGGPATPRLVPRTHEAYAYQARAAAEVVSLTRDDVYLAALPAGSDFVFGCPGIVGTLSVGGTVVLAEDADPAACLPVVERERVTVTSLSPAAVRAWLDAPGPVRCDTSSLRLVQVGGAPLERETAERIGPAWDCRPQQVFAMPEGLLVLTRPGDPDGAVLTTHGRPLSPGDEVRLVDADGEDVPDGESGELLVRGPYTARGYFRAPGENARAFTADGRLRTGVRARRTPDGNLVVAVPDRAEPAPGTPPAE